jgi:hypothetical protein
MPKIFHLHPTSPATGLLTLAECTNLILLSYLFFLCHFKLHIPFPLQPHHHLAYFLVNKAKRYIYKKRERNLHFYRYTNKHVLFIKKSHVHSWNSLISFYWWKWYLKEESKLWRTICYRIFLINTICYRIK